MGRHLHSPVGCQAGHGGWLEYSIENLEQFRCFFAQHVPTGLSRARVRGVEIPADAQSADVLTTLSTDFDRHHPTYHLLPPRDLWPNMVPTLALLRQVMALSGVNFTVHSVYRSTTVNRLSGGASQSAHMDFSGMDITADSEDEKVKWLVRHIWHEKGRDFRMGLGFYTATRFHIDANTPGHDDRRRWGWEDHRAACQRNYDRHFTTALPADGWPDGSASPDSTSTFEPPAECAYSPTC